MPRVCSVCKSPDKLPAEDAILRLVPLSRIAEQTELSVFAVQRHKSGTAALLAMVLAAVGAYWLEHRSVASREQQNAIAVLPLQNINGDFNVDYHRELLAACTQAQRPADMDRIVREAESSAMREPDPAAWYQVGAMMAYCGQKDSALRLLKAAVQQNYCSYSALLEDPLLKDLRKDTAFNQVLTAGSACQEALKKER